MLVLFSLGCLRHKFFDQSAVIFGSKRKLFDSLINSEVCGECLETALSLRGCHSDLLLSSSNNTGAFLADGRLDTSFITLDLFFDLGANFGDLIVELGKLGLYGTETRVGIRRGFAGLFEVLAERLAAIAQSLR